MAVLCLTVFLYVFNVIQVILATVLGGVAIWTFTEVLNLMSQRNPINHQLKEVLTWPEVLPWIFFIAAISTVITNMASFCCLSKKNKPLTLLYTVFQTISVLILITAPIVALTVTSSSDIKNIITTTLWDAFHENKMVENGPYNALEAKFRCCGVMGPSDYKSKQSSFPGSCCYSGNQCDFSDFYANKLNGCKDVIDFKAQYLSKGLCVGSTVTAVIGFLCIIIAVVLFMNLKTKSQKFEKTEGQKLKPTEKDDCQTVLI